MSGVKVSHGVILFSLIQGKNQMKLEGGAQLLVLENDV